MVLIFHYFPKILPTVPGTLPARIQKVLNLGWTGVDLFFVLSGFLIASILISNRESPNYFRAFYGRRVCRLFPTYYLIFALYLLAQHFSFRPNSVLMAGDTHGGVALWMYSVFMQNFGMAIAGGFGATWLAGTWSLAIEEQFYLLLPLVIRRWGTPRNLMKIALTLIAIGPISRAVVDSLAAPSRVQLINYFLLPTRLDALGVGVIIAVLYSRKDRIWHNVARFSTPVCLVSLFVLILMLQGRSDPRDRLFGYTVSAVLYGALLVITLSQGKWTRLMEMKFMQWAGRISYSTYLVHPIVLMLVFGARMPIIESFEDVVRVCVAGALSLLLAWLMFISVEQPAQKLGHELFCYGTSSEGVRDQVGTDVTVLS